MDWLKDIEFKDLLEKDAHLVYEHCGLATLLSLWENLPGITLYVSEKTLFEIKKRYIRKYFDKNSSVYNAKALAVKLEVSEKFIYDALSQTDQKDERQEKLL